MIVKDILDILGAELITGDENAHIGCAFGTDLMSEVLNLAEDGAMLLTGLNNIHTIRTAEMVDIKVITFVRGKNPCQELIDFAQARGIVLLATKCTMFSACGRLYTSGVNGVSKIYSFGTA